MPHLYFTTFNILVLFSTLQWFDVEKIPYACNNDLHKYNAVRFIVFLIETCNPINGRV